MFEILLLSCGLNPRQRFLALLTAIVGYLLILGFPPAAVRSGVMGMLLVIAKLIHRPYQGLHVLILAATFAALANPFVLMWSISFQLSFAAFAGMIIAQPLWDKLFYVLPERFGLRSTIALTCAAQTFTWPLTVNYFKIFSVIAPLANAVIVPMSGIVLIGGFLVPIAKLIPFVGDFILWPEYLITLCMIKITSFFAHLPGAVISVPGFTVFHMATSYVAMILFLIILKKYKPHVFLS